MHEPGLMTRGQSLENDPLIINIVLSNSMSLQGDVKSDLLAFCSILLIFQLASVNLAFMFGLSATRMLS